jgi:hypothetical protein
MYLKASGNMSGSVNFPTPMTAAAITYPKCGFRKEANLTSGRFDNLCTSISGRSLGLRQKRRDSNLFAREVAIAMPPNYPHERWFSLFSPILPMPHIGQSELEIGQR